ncbi:hypothetical protein [Halomontanus rarus]|nr:hypothetical protein [Halovivax sp. TS33]
MGEKDREVDEMEEDDQSSIHEATQTEVEEAIEEIEDCGTIVVGS